MMPPRGPGALSRRDVDGNDVHAYACDAHARACSLARAHVRAFRMTFRPCHKVQEQRLIFAGKQLEEGSSACA